MATEIDRSVLGDVSFDDWKKALELAGGLRLGGAAGDLGRRLPDGEGVRTALAYMAGWRIAVLCAGGDPPLGSTRVLAEGLYPQVHAIAAEATYEDLQLMLTAIRSGNPQTSIADNIDDGASVYLGLVGALFWYDETYVEFERLLYAEGLV